MWQRALKKVYLPVGIVFKGSGFYATDHHSPSGMSSMKADEKAEKAEKGETKDKEKKDTKDGRGRWRKRKIEKEPISKIEKSPEKPPDKGSEKKE